MRKSKLLLPSVFLLFAMHTQLPGRARKARARLPLLREGGKPALSPRRQEPASISLDGHVNSQSHFTARTLPLLLQNHRVSDPRGLPHPPHCKASRVAASFMWLAQAARTTAEGRRWPAGMDGGTGSWCGVRVWPPLLKISIMAPPSLGTAEVIRPSP